MPVLLFPLRMNHPPDFFEGGAKSLTLVRRSQSAHVCHLISSQFRWEYLSR